MFLEEDGDVNELEQMMFSEMQNDDVEADNDNEGIDDVVMGNNEEEEIIDIE